MISQVQMLRSLGRHKCVVGFVVQMAHFSAKRVTVVERFQNFQDISITIIDLFLRYFPITYCRTRVPHMGQLQ